MPLNVLTDLNGCPECLTRGSHFFDDKVRLFRENADLGTCFLPALREISENLGPWFLRGSVLGVGMAIGRKHSARENIQVGRAVAAGPWSKISRDLHQNWKRPLNWISRPGVIAIVIEPNCGVFT